MQDHLTFDLPFLQRKKIRNLRSDREPFFELAFERMSLSNGRLVFKNLKYNWIPFCFLFCLSTQLSFVLNAI